MAYIKKVVIEGFKSFAKRTEIPFEKGVNVIIGPNGSGKSNISDAICFALGRLSVKSMRAEKSKNLIFMGSKYVKPAKEAFVEIVFDNSDRNFALDMNEVTLRRDIKHNGLSNYKINGETKTRAEIIETLAQAGIDPYGFNIILQGQIQYIVKMHGEERRKIIGEVAGISVYEWRKEKSLKELEKTEERLKEISTILRERTSFLNNLEKEKAQAERFQELQLTVKRAKASITKKKLDEKRKEIDSITKSINEKTSQKENKQNKARKIQEEIDKSAERINEINKEIRKASGIEQETLREDITNIKAQLEGLRVRKESFENRKSEFERRIEEMKKTVPEMEAEIRRLRSESPIVAKKAHELKKKKEELALISEERKKVLTLKTNLVNLKERLEEKRIQLERTRADSSSLIKQIEEYAVNLKHQNENNVSEAILNYKNDLVHSKKSSHELNEKEIIEEKKISISEAEIKKNEEIKKKVEKIDVCPLCRSKMTENHIRHVYDECDANMSNAAQSLETSRAALSEIKKEKEICRRNIEKIETELRTLEKEMHLHASIKEKKELLKKAVDYEEVLKKEITELSEKKNSLENKTDNLSEIEEKYENKMLEIEEISSRTEENIDTALLYKERELEKTNNIIERSKEDLREITEQIKEINEYVEEKEDSLKEKLSQEEKMNARFNKMFSERDKLQKQIHDTGLKLSEMNSEVRQIEDQINYLKIGKARLDGERETIEIEFNEFEGIELLEGSMNYLEERLKKSQETLNNIGSINMRALEVYDEVKKEYDIVKEKVETLGKEKEQILKIIEEIDRKKKKTFMKAFNAISELFSRNFAQLYSKGSAYLEIENKEEVFAGGIDIVVKMAKGKYFDVNSLSGGEQTLVALALIFAIQEYKPYHFYLLDEIDAALDKRNSERLAMLLNQYIKSGQYIVVTHNDAIILDSQVLYGVSMHEGVSKILSIYTDAKQKIGQKQIAE